MPICLLQIMPMIVFFGSVVYVLQYVGVLQKVVMLIGYAVAFIIGVSPVEAFVAVANIFMSAVCGNNCFIDLIKYIFKI